MGQIGFSNKGAANRPSQSIWGDCPNTLLNDKGTGYFVSEEFTGGAVSAAATAAMTFGSGVLAFDGDTDSVIAFDTTASSGGSIKLETDGDDNDAAALFSQPLGPITKNSGKKFWFEARVAPGDVDADMGIFVGLVEVAGATRDVLADDVASNGVVTESLVGFLQDNGDDNAFDIVYRKDNGTVVNVLNDATNSAALTAAGETAASLTDNAFWKLGMRFDGRDKLHFYVNGVKVATLTIDSTFDQSKAYCPIVGIKTGTGAAEDVKIDFIRAAFQDQTN